MPELSMDVNVVVTTIKDGSNRVKNSAGLEDKCVGMVRSNMFNQDMSRFAHLCTL